MSLLPAWTSRCQNTNVYVKCSINWECPYCRKDNIPKFQKYCAWGGVMSYITLFKVGFWSHHDRWSPSSIIVIGRIRTHEHADVHEKTCTWIVSPYLGLECIVHDLTLLPSRGFSKLENLLLSLLLIHLEISPNWRNCCFLILLPSRDCSKLENLLLLYLKLFCDPRKYVNLSGRGDSASGERHHHIPHNI